MMEEEKTRLQHQLKEMLAAERAKHEKELAAERAKQDEAFELLAEQGKCLLCKSRQGEETPQGITRNVVSLPCCKLSMCADCLALVTRCPEQCRTHSEEFRDVVETARGIVKSRPRFSRDRQLKIESRLAEGQECYDAFHDAIVKITEGVEELEKRILDSHDLDKVYGCLPTKRSDNIGKNADMEKGLIKHDGMCMKEIGMLRQNLNTVRLAVHQIERSHDTIAEYRAKCVRYAVNIETQEDLETNEEDQAEIERAQEAVAVKLRQKFATRNRSSKRRRTCVVESNDDDDDSKNDS